MLQAAVVSNQIEGLEGMFLGSAQVRYHFLPIGPDWDPDFSPYDLLIVPNGSDQVAMGKVEQQVRRFLDSGKTLFCFDGFYTDWVPGNRWRMDLSKKTIDIRYYLNEDRYGLFEGISLEALNFNHGISGWWACGYILPAEGAEVLLWDTWQRPLMVLDEVSTRGTILLTASAPLADTGFEGEDPRDEPWATLAQLYRNLFKILKHQYTTA